MIQIHEFDPVIYPFKLWVCAKKNQEAFSRFKIFLDDTEIENNPHTAATTICAYEVETNNIGILVAFTSKKHMDVKTIAHEARHAGDMLFELIGDNPHHSEPAAYYTGWVADCIDKVKKLPKTL